MISCVPASLDPADLVKLPLARACTLPAYAYTESDFHGFDLETVIARSWQPLGRSTGLRDVGSQLAADIAGRPVFAVRGSDGQLRGFYNVCKHRGGPLVLENGSARRLHCKYHGWTYTLEGRLYRAPEMEGAADFDPSSICLDPIRLVEWGGLVLAALEEPLARAADFFDGIEEQVAPLEPARLQFHRRVSYELACNWKLYVDNYLEGYHLPHVHPALNRLLDYRRYVTRLERWRSWQESPIDDSKGPYASGSAHYCFVFPNLMLNFLPARLQTNLVVPMTAESCRVVFDYYYPADKAAPAENDMAEDLRFSDEVQREDIAICERVQKGLRSGAYQPGRLSIKREAAVHHFHDLLREAYRQAIDGSA